MKVNKNIFKKDVYQGAFWCDINFKLESNAWHFSLEDESKQKYFLRKMFIEMLIGVILILN